jgi:hypothetical protein
MDQEEEQQPIEPWNVMSPERYRKLVEEKQK